MCLNNTKKRACRPCCSRPCIKNRAVDTKKKSLLKCFEVNASCSINKNNYDKKLRPWIVDMFPEFSFELLCCLLYFPRKSLRNLDTGQNFSVFLSDAWGVHEDCSCVFVHALQCSQGSTQRKSTREGSGGLLGTFGRYFWKSFPCKMPRKNVEKTKKNNEKPKKN